MYPIFCNFTTKLLAISYWLLAPNNPKHYTIMNHNDVCSPLPHREGWGGSPSSLTKSELAQLYFPGAPRSSALRLLHKYITTAHGLLPALEQVGYQRASRRLTRRQVMIIFEYLGEP